MPWQQYVADVLGEIDESGRLAYAEFGLTVPRQSGKSTFILAKAVHRCSAGAFFGRRQRIVYTAQTRQKAREKWEEDYATALEGAKDFKGRYDVHKGNGNEHFRFTNGSRFGIDANTEKAGHGGTIDEAYIDEAFAQADTRLEQAFRPAMITRKNKQLGWISTAGWKDLSPYLEAKVAKGRTAVETGRNRRFAYFEWSASDDCDPTDRDMWRSCMPALGHTITEDAIADELDAVGLAEFQRAYLNLWVPKPKATESNAIVPDEDWEACRDLRTELVGRKHIALDVSPTQGDAAISVAAYGSDGNIHVQVAHSARGTHWVLERLIAGHADTGSPIGIVKGSAAEALRDDLDKAGVPVQEISQGEYATACGELLADVTSPERRLRHRAQEVLDEAVRSATSRASGERWVFDRRKSNANITPLCASAVAARMARTEQADAALENFW